MSALQLPALPLLFLPNLGPVEIGVIFLIVLILFGPGKMPDVFRAFGDGIRQFKKAASGENDPPSLPPPPAEKSDPTQPPSVP